VPRDYIAAIVHIGVLTSSEFLLLYAYIEEIKVATIIAEAQTQQIAASLYIAPLLVVLLSVSF
jgi:hypothetical protein